MKAKFANLRLKKMGYRKSLVLLNCLGLAVLALALFSSAEKLSVSYDGRALRINGQRKIIISGSIHYPRSTPEVLFSCFFCFFIIFFLFFYNFN